MNFSKSNLSWLSALALLVLWTVGWTFGFVVISHGFVYDDQYLILTNEYLYDWKNILFFLTRDVTQASPLAAASGYYRPFSMVFLQVLFHLFEFSAWKYHVVNLFIHAANCFLVAVLAWQFSANRRIAFISAMLFAVHPVHNETIVPIYSYMGLLTALGALLATVCFIHGKRRAKTKALNSPRNS